MFKNWCCYTNGMFLATKACNMILGTWLYIQLNIFMPAVGETGDAQVCVQTLKNVSEIMWNYVKQVVKTAYANYKSLVCLRSDIFEVQGKVDLCKSQS